MPSMKQHQERNQRRGQGACGIKGQRLLRGLGAVPLAGSRLFPSVMTADLTI
nr:hypothetical protein [Tanacetum cinerariifolium]